MKLQCREDDQGDFHVGLAQEVERGHHEEAADVEKELADSGDVARPSGNVGLSQQDCDRKFN